MAEDLHSALTAAGETFKTKRAEMEKAREALLPVMVKALKSGKFKQRDVVELSGYTRESVRTLARRNGVEPE